MLNAISFDDAVEPSAPAYSIITPRLRLVPASPEHAVAVKQAVDASLPELQAWMTWSIGQPHAIETHIGTLRSFRAQFERDEEYHYVLFERVPEAGTSGVNEAIVGLASLRRSQGPEALEIGYWIRSDRAGRGLGGEGAAALTRVGFELHAVIRMEIRVAVGNARSSAIPRRLGYTLDAVLRRRIALPGDRLADVEAWTMMREELHGSPCARVDVEARDAVGRRLL